MGKIDKIMNRTIKDRGEFWKIVVVMIVVATLIVSLATFGFRSCAAAVVESTWTTPDASSTQADGGPLPDGQGA